MFTDFPKVTSLFSVKASKDRNENDLTYKKTNKPKKNNHNSSFFSSTHSLYVLILYPCFQLNTVFVVALG